MNVSELTVSAGSTVKCLPDENKFYFSETLGSRSKTSLEKNKIIIRAYYIEFEMM